MSDLRLYNLQYFLLFTTMSSGFEQNPIHQPEPILNQIRNSQRTEIKVKPLSPLLNYLNPNVVDSKDSTRSEYQPALNILTKQNMENNNNDKQKVIGSKHKEVNLNTTENKSIKNNGNKHKDRSCETEDIKIEIDFEYAERISDYDADMSTTEDYSIEDRFSSDIVASLLG